MKIIKNKTFLIIFATIFILFIGSLTLNLTSTNKNIIEAKKTNKIFSINATFNKEKNQFLLSTENNLSFIKNINKFTHNISYVIFNIDETDHSKIAHLFELPENINLGFSKFNEDLLQKTHYFGHQFLLKLNFYNSDQKDKNDELWININDDLEKNNEKLEKYKKFLQDQKSSIYIEDRDVAKIENDQLLIDKLLEFNPFITTKQNICNDKTRICFISKDEKNLTLKTEEIFSKYIKNNDKWFIVIEYDSNNIKEIERAVKIHDNKFLNLDSKILNSILENNS
jgi:hypothetical protein